MIKKSLSDEQLANKTVDSPLPKAMDASSHLASTTSVDNPVAAEPNLSSQLFQEISSALAVVISKDVVTSKDNMISESTGYVRIDTPVIFIAINALNFFNKNIVIFNRLKQTSSSGRLVNLLRV
jgi:hypothetical protein